MQNLASIDPLAPCGSCLAQRLRLAAISMTMVGLFIRTNTNEMGSEGFPQYW